MSSQSQCEKAMEVDWTASIRGTRFLVFCLIAAHLSTGLYYSLLSDTSVWDAVFLNRGLQFRVMVGGQYLSKVVMGDWWRLISSVFLHINGLHLFVNVVAIMALGRILEPWIGVLRFGCGFLLSGLGGSIASQCVGVLQSDGASGGAYGLLGLIIILCVRQRHLLKGQDRLFLGPILWIFLLINLFVSGFVPAIDLVGHIGGLFVGVILGFFWRVRV